MSAIRAGVVVTIRVNPRNCQNVLDIVELLGVKPEGQSFSSFVSLAFASLLEASMDAGHIPEPDPYEYLNRMRPYLGKKRNQATQRLTKTVQASGARLKPPTMPKRDIAPPPTSEEAIQKHEAVKRMRDLGLKYKASTENTDIQWSTTDQREWEETFAVIFPGEPLMQPSQSAWE